MPSSARRVEGLRTNGLRTSVSNIQRSRAVARAASGVASTKRSSMSPCESSASDARKSRPGAPHRSSAGGSAGPVALTGARTASFDSAASRRRTGRAERRWTSPQYSAHGDIASTWTSRASARYASVSRYARGRYEKPIAKMGGPDGAASPARRRALASRGVGTNPAHRSCAARHSRACHAAMASSTSPVSAASPRSHASSQSGRESAYCQ